MRNKRTSLFILTLIVASSFSLTMMGCVGMQMGSEAAKTTATGSASGSSTENVNPSLQRCEEPLGTIAVVEDRYATWFVHLTTDWRLGSTAPVLKLLAQQSGCFVVVERGRGMHNVLEERYLRDSGELRAGANFEKGKMVAADYSMNPSITFSNNKAGQIGSAVGGLFGSVGALIGGSLTFKEASTLLTLVDNRSGVQLAIAEGSARNVDMGALGAFLGGGYGGGLGGYSNTAEGKVIVASFTDSFNKMVQALRNYKAQEIQEGLGTGGKLKVQGS